jgi:hypothetical protein
MVTTARGVHYSRSNALSGGSIASMDVSIIKEFQGVRRVGAVTLTKRGKHQYRDSNTAKQDTEDDANFVEHHSDENSQADRKHADHGRKELE